MGEARKLKHNCSFHIAEGAEILSDARALVLIALAVCSGPVQAQDAVSDEIIAFWAEYAIPLDEFVAQGYGQSEPQDAKSSEWCSHQPNTISLLYADSPVCERLLAKMEAMGRIKARQTTP